MIDDQADSGTPEEIAAIDEFNAGLEAEGRLVLACGITAPSEARVVDGRGDEPVVTRGPLHSAREFVSGFWVLRADDAAHGERLALEASRACGRRIEVRALH